MDAGAVDAAGAAGRTAGEVEGGGAIDDEAADAGAEDRKLGCCSRRDGWRVGGRGDGGVGRGVGVGKSGMNRCGGAIGLIEGAQGGGTCFLLTFPKLKRS